MSTSEICDCNWWKTPAKCQTCPHHDKELVDTTEFPASKLWSGFDPEILVTEMEYICVDCGHEWKEYC